MDLASPGDTITHVAKRNVIPMNLGAGKTHTGVDGQAKAAIKRMADLHGMKEMAVVSRIFLWASQQTDDILVKGMLGLLPVGYESEVIELALKRLAGGKSKGK